MYELTITYWTIQLENLVESTDRDVPATLRCPLGPPLTKWFLNIFLCRLPFYACNDIFDFHVVFEPIVTAHVQFLECNSCKYEIDVWYTPSFRIFHSNKALNGISFPAWKKSKCWDLEIRDSIVVALHFSQLHTFFFEYFGLDTILTLLSFG